MPGYMLRNNQMGHPVMGEIAPRRTAVFIWLWLACLVDIILHKHIMYYSQRHAHPMKTAVRLGPIAHLKACVVWYCNPC